MDRLKRRRKWRRWTGPLSDLADAADVAIATIERQTGSAPRCEIEVVWPKAGRARTLDTTDALRVRVQERDFPGITSIRIEVGDEKQAFVSIQASTRSPAISLEVQGDDDPLVEGLFVQLSESLSRSGRWATTELVLLLSFFGSALYLGFAMFAFPHLFDLPETRKGNAEWRGAPLALALGPPFAFVALMWWATQPFELLASGQVDRLRRFRIWIGVFLTAVVAGVVSAVLVR